MSYIISKQSTGLKLLFSTLIAVLSLAFSATFSNLSAHEYKVGELEIIHPWSRATPNGAKVAGGYFKIINHGKTPDRLVSVSSELSDKAEIHSMEVTDGVMKMRHQPEGIVIPAGGEIEFKPGGYHVMFMDITKTLKKGDKVAGKLNFEKAGSVDVNFAVDAMGVKSPGENSNSGAEHQH